MPLKTEAEEKAALEADEELSKADKSLREELAQKHRTGPAQERAAKLALEAAKAKEKKKLEKENAMRRQLTAGFNPMNQKPLIPESTQSDTPAPETKPSTLSAHQTKQVKSPQGKKMQTSPAKTPGFGTHTQNDASINVNFDARDNQRRLESPQQHEGGHVKSERAGRAESRTSGHTARSPSVHSRADRHQSADARTHQAHDPLKRGRSTQRQFLSKQRPHSADTRAPKEARRVDVQRPESAKEKGDRWGREWQDRQKAMDDEKRSLGATTPMVHPLAHAPRNDTPQPFDSGLFGQRTTATTEQHTPRQGHLPPLGPQPLTHKPSQQDAANATVPGPAPPASLVDAKPVHVPHPPSLVDANQVHVPHPPPVLRTPASLVDAKPVHVPHPPSLVDANQVHVPHPPPVLRAHASLVDANPVHVPHPPPVPPPPAGRSSRPLQPKSNTLPPPHVLWRRKAALVDVEHAEELIEMQEKYEKAHRLQLEQHTATQQTTQDELEEARKRHGAAIQEGQQQHETLLKTELDKQNQLLKEAHAATEQITQDKHEAALRTQAQEHKDKQELSKQEHEANLRIDQFKNEAKQQKSTEEHLQLDAKLQEASKKLEEARKRITTLESAPEDNTPSGTDPPSVEEDNRNPATLQAAELLLRPSSPDPTHDMGLKGPLWKHTPLAPAWPTPPSSTPPSPRFAPPPPGPVTHLPPPPRFNPPPPETRTSGPSSSRSSNPAPHINDTPSRHMAAPSDNGTVLAAAKVALADPAPQRPPPPRPPPPLPVADAQWVVHTNDADGRLYYENTNTGETTWERPADLGPEPPHEEEEGHPDNQTVSPPNVTAPEQINVQIFHRNNEATANTQYESFKQKRVVRTNIAHNSQSQQTTTENTDFDNTNKCCYYLYAIILIIVCVLSILGLAAWLDKNDFGKATIDRKNLLGTACYYNQAGCTDKAPKTHQCVHAFARGYEHESIGVQTPFLPMSTATKADVIKSMQHPENAESAGMQYDVLDLCSIHPGTAFDAGMEAAYKSNQTDVKKHVISCLQTQEFCPDKIDGAPPSCPAWYSRIGGWATRENYENMYSSLIEGNKNNAFNDVWKPFNPPEMPTSYSCQKFDNTYKKFPEYARDICRMMRTPRMALTHLQNNEYNLFSTQNELCLAVCLNAVVFVFSFTYCIQLLRDFFRTNGVDRHPWLKNGVARFFVAVPAVIVIAASLSMMTTTQAEAPNINKDKTTLFPTGSIIIAVISGGLAVVLVSCAPFYSGVHILQDKGKNGEVKDGPEHADVGPNAGIYTNTSTARYYRFIRSRNDLLIAYCNFLTFPILVLMIYVRYNWYSIDTHVQRAFFSAVAVGVLDITEVSVMGALYLVTEFEEFGKRKTAVGPRDEDRQAPTYIWFRHSNLVNVAVQLVFFLSKMAVFIPTIHQIRQELAWVHREQGTMQFKGQRDGQQPLVAVMIASFVLNHVVALLESVCYNIGLYPASWINTAVFQCNCFGDWKPKPWGKFHFRLVMFAVMNLSVVSVVNFTEQ